MLHMCNRLQWPRWLWRYWRRCWRLWRWCWRLGRRSGRCLAQMLRYDLACTLRALSGDLQGEVGQLLGRQPQRTGAEVGTRAAVGVRIFQHVREVGHGANSSTARPLSRRSPARSLWPFLARCAFAAWPDLGDRRSRMVRLAPIASLGARLELHRLDVGPAEDEVAFDHSHGERGHR